MIKLEKNSIVYVCCPAYLKTGGPELLHQLVHTLNYVGIKSYITYYDLEVNREDYTNKDFKKYVKEFKLLKDVEDNSKNLLIVPEISVELMKKYNNIKKAIWWLSVDNYEITYLYKKRKNMLGFKSAFKRLIKNILKNNTKKDIYIADYHLCQSYYAIDYLKKKGINNSFYLSDYLNDTYLETKFSYDKKEDFVLYNPKKGFEFTKKIMLNSPDLNWKPIENMTTNQVRELLIKSKVYIDFGNHPGKDRFPRETAICGCCVLTGKKGAAYFKEDVPILDEFKFDDNDKNIDKIVSKIKDCLKNYKKEIIKFEDYRKFILSEKKKFIDDVRRIFVIQK